MSLWLRGLLWFGLYVVLSLLPLAAALALDPFAVPRPAGRELGAALGLIGFSVVLFQFALVSRIKAASRPFGTDALTQFHQQMGIVGLALVVAHPIFFPIGWRAWNPLAGPAIERSGAIALWALVALIVTSVGRKRLRLRYEIWQVTHLVLAAAAAAALLAHVLFSTGYARVPFVRGVLAGYVGVFLVLTLRHRVVRPALLRRRPWAVVGNDAIGGSTSLLRLRPLGHDGFAFDPGQFAWLMTGRMPLWTQQHPLSIASSAESGRKNGVEFAVKALGDWSGTVVPALTPGARVWVDGPFGAFTTERTTGQGFVFIAGGIGITPIRSMLLTMRDRGDRRETLLVQAAHDESGLLFEDDLRQLERDLGLRVVRVLETAPAGWTGERGHVSRELLQRLLPARFLRFDYFVCGPVTMMDALEGVLTGLGIPAASVHTERFDMV